MSLQPQMNPVIDTVETLNPTLMNNTSQLKGLSTRPQIKAFRRLLGIMTPYLYLGVLGPITLSAFALAIAPFSKELQNINTPQYRAYLDKEKQNKSSVGFKAYMYAREALRSVWFYYPKELKIESVPSHDFTYEGQKRPALRYDMSFYKPGATQSINLGSYDSVPNFYNITVYDNTKIQLLLDAKKNWRVDPSSLKYTSSAPVAEYKFEFTATPDNPGPYKFTLRNPYTGDTKDIVYKINKDTSGNFRYGIAFAALLTGFGLLRLKKIVNDKNLQKQQETLSDLFQQIVPNSYGPGYIISKIDERTVPMLEAIFKNQWDSEKKKKEKLTNFVDNICSYLYSLQDKVSSQIYFNYKDRNSVNTLSFNKDKNTSIMEFMDSVKTKLTQFLEGKESAWATPLKKQLNQGLLFYSFSQPEEEFRRIIDYLKSTDTNFYDLAPNVEFIKDKSPALWEMSAPYFIIHSLLRLNEDPKDFIKNYNKEDFTRTQENLKIFLKEVNYPVSYNNHVLNCFLGLSDVGYEQDITKELLDIVLAQYTPAQLSQYAENKINPILSSTDSVLRAPRKRGLETFKISIEKALLQNTLTSLAPEVVKTKSRVSKI